MDFSSIKDIDFQILQWFNGSNNVILDQLVMALTRVSLGYRSILYSLSS